MKLKKTLFVDTSAWDAIKDRNDRHHKAAVEFLQTIVTQKIGIMTSSYVLDETYTLLLNNVGYAVTVRFQEEIEQLEGAGILEIVHVSKQVEKDAWDVFESFNKDKDWSFTDCTSKVLMEKLGINEAFAFDHHFEQMGFIRKP